MLEVSTLEILLGFSVGLSLVILLLIIFLFVKSENFFGRSEKSGRSDRRLKNRLAKKFEEEAGKQLEQAIRTSTETLEKLIKQNLSQISENAYKQNQQLAVFIQEQERAVLKESQYLVANNVVKIEKELADYKANQLTKIEQQIHQIVFAAAREVLGRAISLSEHEDMVNKAIERAKRDKFFS